MVLLQETFNLERFKKKQKTKNYQIVRKELLDSITKKKYGFIQDLLNKDYSKIFSVVKKLKKFDHVLFLGTGGSSLGGKTLVSIYGNQFINLTKPNIYFLENIDSIQITNLLKAINLKRTACVVISKSGETIETISQYFFVENTFRKKRIETKERFFVITEEKRSTLKKIQESNDFLFLPHPKSVGGRFSVFSIVGLLPAALINIDIKKICEGGKGFLKKIKNLKYFDDYFLSVLSLIELNKKNVNMSVIMPYSDSLNNLSFWYRQLWGESIGKNQKGITPINALGTIDQHSQLQLYLDGPKDKFFTIIGIKKLNKDRLSCIISKDENYEPMHKKSMEKLLECEMRATIQTLNDKKLPVRVFIMDLNNEKQIGNLMMLFFIETILGCLLLNIYPFDQPAVEKGKKLTKIYLKKYE